MAPAGGSDSRPCLPERKGVERVVLGGSASPVHRAGMTFGEGGYIRKKRRAIQRPVRTISTGGPDFVKQSIFRRKSGY